MAPVSSSRLELYLDEGNDAYCVARDFACPKDYISLHPGILYWTDVRSYTVSQFINHERDILLKLLGELLSSPVRSPDSDRVHCPRINLGLRMMKMLIIEHDPEKNRLLIHAQHRDGTGSHMYFGHMSEVPMSASNDAFSLEIRRAFVRATDYSEPAWPLDDNELRRLRAQIDPGTPHQNRALSESRRDLIERLELEGYYSHTPPEFVMPLKESFVRYGDLYMPHLQRVSEIDTEDAAERGMVVVVGMARPFLRRLCVPLDDYGEHLTEEGGYWVRANGVSYEIQSSHAHNELTWPEQTLECISVLNAILERAGCSELVYANTSDGANFECIFLSDEMYRIISAREMLVSSPIQLVNPAEGSDWTW